MHANIISDDENRIAELLRSTHRVAVLGIKPESHPSEPGHYVPAALQERGVTIVPVPVYYPEVTTILGEPVIRRLADVPGDIDIIDVFRRGNDVPAHLADLIARRPRAVWLQSGIRHDASAEALAEAGILVVQDRRLMVDHRRFVSAR